MLSVAEQVAILVARYGNEIDSPDVLEVTPAMFDELAKDAGWIADLLPMIHYPPYELKSVVKVGRRLVRIVPVPNSDANRAPPTHELPQDVTKYGFGHRTQQNRRQTP